MDSRFDDFNDDFDFNEPLNSNMRKGKSKSKKKAQTDNFLRGSDELSDEDYDGNDDYSASVSDDVYEEEFPDRRDKKPPKVAKKSAHQTKTNKTKKAKTKKSSNDFQDEITASLLSKGRLGVPMFLYVLFGYGFFVFKSSTALFLLLGFVIIYEQNRDTVRALTNILALYLFLNVGWSVFLAAYSAFYGLAPDTGLISSIKSILGAARIILEYAYDLAFAIIGLMGMSRAKKGRYIRLNYVDSLFD